MVRYQLRHSPKLPGKVTKRLRLVLIAALTGRELRTGPMMKVRVRPGRYPTSEL